MNNPVLQKPLHTFGPTSCKPIRFRVYEVYKGNVVSERGHWGDPGVDRRIILIWIYKK
jgi:hypothetical protein